MNENETNVLMQSLKEQYEQLQLAYTAEEVRLKSIIKKTENKISKSSVVFQTSCIQNRKNEYEKSQPIINQNISSGSVSSIKDESKSMINLRNQIEIEHPEDLSFVLLKKPNELDSFFSSLNKIDSDNSSSFFNDTTFLLNEQASDYDYIIDIPSFTSLTSTGWPFSRAKNSEETKEVIVCSLIGAFHTGKSFFLSQLCNSLAIKNSFDQHSRSLNFKYDQKYSIMYVDTKGSNLPYKYIKNKEQYDTMNDSLNLFRCKEQFIENYAIKKGSVVLYFMGYASQSEIDKLKKIEKECNKPMFVIHNLYMFSSYKTIGDYYLKVLVPVFNLKKKSMNLLEGSLFESQDLVGVVFYETIENEKNKESDRDSDESDEVKKEKTIYHLLFGNTENIKKFEQMNKYTLNFLIEQISQINKKKFNIEKSIKKRIKKWISNFFNVTKNNIKVKKEEYYNSLNFNLTSKRIVFNDQFEMRLNVPDFDNLTSHKSSTFLVKNYIEYLDEKESNYCVKICLPYVPKTMEATIKEDTKELIIFGEFEKFEKQDDQIMNTNTIREYSEYKFMVQLPNLEKKTIVNKYSFFEIEDSMDIIIKYPLTEKISIDE